LRFNGVIFSLIGNLLVASEVLVMISSILKMLIRVIGGECA